MGIVIKEAELAGQSGDKPIAAILVHNNKIIGKMANTWNTRNSKVHHAENHLCVEHANYLRVFGKECRELMEKYGDSRDSEILL